MKKIVLAAFATATALSTAAFAQEPPQLYGNYSAAVKNQYNKGPAERRGYSEPMMLDTMPTASIPENETTPGQQDDDLELDYGPNVDERDVEGR